jgi:hypothetical protein
MCEIIKIHINETVLGTNQLIDQQKIDLVARMGGNWYCRAHGEALFEIEKPITTIGIGVDVIPSAFRNSNILTGNNLGQLGNLEKLPTSEEVLHFKTENTTSFKTEREKHTYLKALLDANKPFEAWCLILS